MTRCRRCGTNYSDGMRHCPRCGEPEYGGNGAFAAPCPGSAKESHTQDSLPQHKQAMGFMAIPLPFAIIVIGILLNPTLYGWLATVYYRLSTPPSHVIFALNYALHCISVITIITVLEASIRKHRGGRLLKVVASALILTTIFGLLDSLISIQRSVEFMLNL